MSRRADAKTKKRAQEDRRAPAIRAASPRRELLGLTPRSAASASALATGAVLGGTLGGLVPTVSAAAAAAAVGAVGLKVGGHTLGEWISLRRRVSTLPTQAALFDHDRVGVVFDGRTASVVIEVTPRPWQLTTITATGTSEAPQLSADQLRRLLTQYDIRCSRLTVVCAGYKFAARDAAAGVLDTLIGPVSAPLGGTTVIIVSVDLEAETLASAYRRIDPNSTDKSLPRGLCRTVTVAARRVCTTLAESGFGAAPMTPQRVRQLHTRMLTQIAAPLSQPGWDSCGAPSGVHTRTYAPTRGHWNAESAGAWHHLPSHRQYTTLTLTPYGDGGQAFAQPLVTYLLPAGEQLSGAAGYGLAPVRGQQVAGLSQALPVATRVPLRTPAAVIDDTTRLGFGLPAGGAGMFVGSTAEKTRVFVAASPAAEPLWVIGPRLFALQMVARLSTQDLRIAVMLTEDTAWKEFVEHRDTPTLTFGTLDSLPADVVVTTPSWWERNRDRCAGKTVILVTEKDPGSLAANRLNVFTAPDGSTRIAVRVDEQSIEVGWELTALERRVLLGEVDDEGAYPSTAHDVELSESAYLPAPPPRPKPRVLAPAPVVQTVAEVSPEDLMTLTPEESTLGPLLARIPEVDSPVTDFDFSPAVSDADFESLVEVAGLTDIDVHELSVASPLESSPVDPFVEPVTVSPAPPVLVAPAPSPAPGQEDPGVESHGGIVFAEPADFGEPVDDPWMETVIAVEDAPRPGRHRRDTTEGW